MHVCYCIMYIIYVVFAFWSCVHWRSELQRKLLAHSPTPVAQPYFLLLQWWFHLFSLIIPVDIKLSRQAGGYIV